MPTKIPASSPSATAWPGRPTFPRQRSVSVAASLSSRPGLSSTPGGLWNPEELLAAFPSASASRASEQRK